jgi:hypothetical protein
MQTKTVVKITKNTIRKPKILNKVKPDYVLKFNAKIRAVDFLPVLHDQQRRRRYYDHVMIHAEKLREKDLR